MKTAWIALTVFVSLTAMADPSRDDGADMGTSATPQVQRQQGATDKGPIGVHQDGVPQDDSHLGDVRSPQVREQGKRTEKGLGERPEKKHRKRLLRNKDEKAGTTQGNPVQPTVPESAPPATTH